METTVKKLEKSMVEVKATFTAEEWKEAQKKAKGKILFSCLQGEEVARAILAAVETKQGQILRLKSRGVDSHGALVSEMVFEWSIKLKNSKQILMNVKDDVKHFLIL